MQKVNHCRNCGSVLSEVVEEYRAVCVTCDPLEGVSHSDIRGPESLSPRDVELIGWLTEECGEVSQRAGKILRWGWYADYAGTDQQSKLETELGDVCAAIAVLIHNGLIVEENVRRAAHRKIIKLAKDAATHRQLLRHADIPEPA